MLQAQHLQKSANELTQLKNDKSELIVPNINLVGDSKQTSAEQLHTKPVLESTPGQTTSEEKQSCEVLPEAPETDEALE